MKRKKIEKTIFTLLYVLPFILVGVFWLYQIVYSHHHEYTITIQGLYTSFYNVFENATTGLIYAPIYYVLNDIIQIGTDLSSVIAFYLQYCIVVEFACLIYKLIVLLPRVCTSLVDSGVDK